MAQVTLTINAESITELIDQLRSLALPTGMKIEVHEIKTPAAAHVAPTTEQKLDRALDRALDEVERTEAAVDSAKPKRGRPAKAADPVPTTAPMADNTATATLAAPAPAPVTPAQVNDVLFNEAKQALGDYVAGNKECGREKAIEMLKSLGVARLTELDAAGLQKFLALVKAA